MKNLFFLLLIVSLVGCKSSKTASSYENTTIKDSTVVTFTPVDTIVKFPKDSVTIRIPIRLLGETPVIRSNNRATLSLSKIGEDIEAECKAEELERIIRLLRRDVEHYKSVVTEKGETIVVTERYTPKLVKWLAWIGGLFLLFHGIKVILKFYNPFSR